MNEKTEDHNEKYIMEDERESDRLIRKVDIPKFVSRYLKRYLSNSLKILDVGCGPGHISAQIAEMYPGSEVTGIDISRQRINDGLAYCERFKNLNLHCADAVSLPFEDNTFDFVFARFVLEYIKDTQKAVQEIIRVCKKGGRVLLQDLDGQLLWHYPEDRQLLESINSALNILKATGFDPFVGRKLYTLAYNSGLNNIKVGAESYHLYAGKIDQYNYQNWQMKFEIIIKYLTGSISANQLEKTKTEFLNYFSREDSLTYSVVFTVSGRKKG